MTWKRRRISSSLNTYGGGRCGFFTAVSAGGAHARQPNWRTCSARSRRTISSRRMVEAVRCRP